MLRRGPTRLGHRTAANSKQRDGSGERKTWRHHRGVVRLDDKAREQILIMSPPPSSADYNIRRELCSITEKKHMAAPLYISAELPHQSTINKNTPPFYKRCPAAGYKGEAASFQRILPFMGDELEY